MESIRKVSLLFVCFYLPVFATAQEVPLTVTKPQDHSYYLDLLSTAKDSSYNDIIRLYDGYLKQFPSDFHVQIEKCNVIDMAYYDSYEEYNPKYEEFETCLKNVVAKFPDEPEVMLFKVDHIFGDSAKIFLEDVLERYKNNPERWKGKGIWKVYEQIATYYDSDDDQSKINDAIRYAELAQDENDTLDLSYFLARQYKKQKKNLKAIAVLESDIDSTDAGYELNQKGKLLLELGVPDKALQAFQFARRDTSNWIDSENLAQALIENGLASQAREYLVKGAANEWSHPGSLLKLLDYDMRFGSADSAKAVYGRMVEENFWYDALGIYRLKLFWYAPSVGWKFSDLARVSLLFVLLVLLFMIPYLWILPIYNVGLYLKERKGLVLLPSDFRWGLKHFWIISFLWLTVDVMAHLVFYYDELIVSYTGHQTTSEAGDIYSKSLADQSVFFLSGMLIVTCFFMRKSDLPLLLGDRWGTRETIGRGVGAAFVLKFLLTLYLGFYKLFDLASIDFTTLLSANEEIISINKYYNPALGFLIVVILVPIYEEIIFRGVILSAIEKHLKFGWANGIQATLFAVLHMELRLIPFFMLFGFAAGHFRNRSQSLAPGIVMHMVNNLLAFLGLLWLGNRLEM